MSESIHIKNLTKTFKSYNKQPGLRASLKGLFSREYKELKAVDDISFDIKQGEMVGFIGPNGAGKTTTLKMLSGLLYPTVGDIEVLGFTPYKRKPEFLKQISLVMGQKNQLWWDLPAIETFNLNKEIYEVPKDRYEQVVNDLVDMLDLKDVIYQQVRKLSLGQRMKCELVASLIHTPKVLFLDEPTIGLDVVMQKRIRQFIKEYNKKYNATVILTSHYMDDVKEVCDRIIIINHGKLLFDGSMDSLIHKYADYKTISVVLDKKVTKEELHGFGKIEEIGDHKFVLNVPRKDTSSTAAKILTKFAVDDLDIAEPRLENIVSEIFSEA